MNSKIALVGVLTAALLFGGSKKPAAKKVVPQDIPEDTPEDTPDQEEKKTQKKDTFPSLTSARIKTINDYINSLPLDSGEDPLPYRDYFQWKDSPGIPSDYYEDWLSNIIYWKIARLEQRIDLYDDPNSPVPGHDLPFFLYRGKKGHVYWDNKKGFVFDIINFDETKPAADKRLAKGIALWSDISKYLKNNLKKFPAGVVHK